MEESKPKRINQKTKEKAATALGAVAGLLFTGGLTLIPYSVILGCSLAATGAIIGWLVLVWMRWFEFLKWRFVPHLGCIAIILGFTVLVLCLRNTEPKSGNAAGIPQGPIAVTAPNSPASTIIAAGEGSQVTVNQTNPDIDRQLKEILSAVTQDGNEMRRLEKDYDLGFALIAVTGEVDATRVAPYADRITGDWQAITANIDKKNRRMWIEIPNLYFRSPGYADVILGGHRSNLPAVAGMKFRDSAYGEVQMYVGCLKAKPVGVCAVLGFQKRNLPHK